MRWKLLKAYAVLPVFLSTLPRRTPSSRIVSRMLCESRKLHARVSGNGIHCGIIEGAFGVDTSEYLVEVEGHLVVALQDPGLL